mmetsp:Transcript_21123/g.26678  ORF Transcript_21123/g.26678 Transcript_21123/m.26678 type:complete len:156 (-) Transcript_21123:197-664(-)
MDGELEVFTRGLFHFKTTVIDTVGITSCHSSIICKEVDQIKRWTKNILLKTEATTNTNTTVEPNVHCLYAVRVQFHRHRLRKDVALSILFVVLSLPATAVVDNGFTALVQGDCDVYSGIFLQRLPGYTGKFCPAPIGALCNSGGALECQSSTDDE